MSYDIKATFRKTSSDHDPGIWTFSTGATIPALEYDTPEIYQYDLESEPGWTYAAVSIHLRDDETTKSDNAFITVKKGDLPQAGYDNFHAEVVLFDDGRLQLRIENRNASRSDIYLGLSLTVGDGTRLRTSQDPQIRLRKKP